MVTEMRDLSARTEQSHTMVHLPLISTSQLKLCAVFVQSQVQRKSQRTACSLALGLAASWMCANVAQAQSIKSAQTVSFNIPGPEQQGTSQVVSIEGHTIPQEPASGVTVAQPLVLEPVATNQISGHVVGCQAACCWPLAKLLDQRASTLLAEAQSRHERAQTSARLQAHFLQHQAAAQRDVAAGLALKTYYSWIANKQQLQLVEEGLQLQREQLATQEALIQKGIAIPDPTALDRKRLELEDNRVQLNLAERQLAAGLSRLTCCQTDLRSSTTEALDIQPQDIDCDALVRFALEHRHDYLAIVRLCQCLDEDTALSIAQLLTPLVGVGIDMLDLNLLERLSLKHRGDELLNQVRKELKLASDVWRMRIEQSVCDKCQALSAAYERVSIAQEVIRSWETRIAALKRLEELGDARGEALATARAELIGARSILMNRQLAAKLAEVELAEAVGDLALRCCQGQPWLVR